MSIMGIARAALAATMLAIDYEMPAIGGRPIPTVERRAEYDGTGRKKKAPAHPNHNAERRTKAWRDYAARVVATHSNRPDPRADEYLHAAARLRRGEMRRAA